MQDKYQFLTIEFYRLFLSGGIKIAVPNCPRYDEMAYLNAEVLNFSQEGFIVNLQYGCGL
jgi:hypothetical protein